MITRNYLFVRLLVFLSIPSFAWAQAKNQVFPEGIYLSWTSLQLSQPDIPKNQVVSESNTFTLRSKVKNDSIQYRSGDGRISPVSTAACKSLFENGTLYVVLNQLAHRVSFIGSLSLFTESYPLIKAPFSPVAVEQMKEVTPRMIDLSNGRVYNYSVDDMQEFLASHDKELSNSFAALGSRRAKRDQLYHYTELYNEKHPYSTH